MLVLCLHPVPRLIVKQVCRPPEVAPATPFVLAQIVRAILDPAAEGTPPGQTLPPAHRPQHITFPDPELAAACAHSLATVGVQASVLSASPGVGQMVRALSGFMLQRNMAKGSPVGDKPGLCSSPGVTPDVARAFLKLIFEFAARQPWNRINERQLLRIRGAPVPGMETDGHPSPTVAWVGVVGNRMLMERQQKLKAGVPPQSIPPPNLGLCVFFKRYDAEYRLLCMHGQPSEGEDGPMARKQRPPPPSAVSNPLDMVCARPECGKARDDCEADLLRCGRCKEVYYCGKECQSDDWKRHAPECKRNTVPEAGPAGHWGTRETVLMLENPFQLPHDDHELLDELGMEAPHMMLHPVPLTFNKEGLPGRPSLGELVWLMRGMATVMRMMETRPRDLLSIVPMAEEAELDFGRATNEEHWYDAVPDAPPHVVHVRSDPILTKDEHARLLEAMAKDAAAQAASASGVSAEGASTEGDSEGGKAEAGSSAKAASTPAAGSSSGSGEAPSGAGASPVRVKQAAAAATPAPAKGDETDDLFGAMLSAETLAAAAGAAEKTPGAQGAGESGDGKEGGCVVQ